MLLSISIASKPASAIYDTRIFGNVVSKTVWNEAEKCYEFNMEVVEIIEEPEDISLKGRTVSVLVYDGSDGLENCSNIDWPLHGGDKIEVKGYSGWMQETLIIDVTCGSADQYIKKLALHLPDLTITDITWYPIYPTADRIITFTAHIKNRGDVSSDSCTVKWYFDTIHWGDSVLDSLSPDESTTDSSAGRLDYTSAGIHTIRAVVDANEVVSESNEYNNELAKKCEVSQSACFIATAVYGSELAPEVQFLREYRDDTVSKTFAGSCFMEVFNTIYYSFSPIIANSISMNPWIKPPLRVYLTPLLKILHLSSDVYIMLHGINPELAMIVSGMFTSFLISMVYYLSPLVAIMLIMKKRINSRRWTKVAAMLYMIVATLLICGEATLSKTAMTSAFIIAIVPYALALISRANDIAKIILKYLKPPKSSP